MKFLNMTDYDDSELDYKADNKSSSSSVKNPVFTNDEIVKLLRIVKKNPDSYLSFSDKIDQKERTLAWKHVTDEFNASGRVRDPNCIKVKFRGLKSQYKYKKNVEAGIRAGRIDGSKYIRKPVLSAEAQNILDEILEEEEAAMEEKEFFKMEDSEMDNEGAEFVDADSIVEYDPENEDYEVEYLAEEMSDVDVVNEERGIPAIEETPQVKTEKRTMKRGYNSQNNSTPKPEPKPFMNKTSTSQTRNIKSTPALNKKIKVEKPSCSLIEDQQIPTSTSRLRKENRLSSADQSSTNTGKKDLKLSDAQAEYFRDRNLREAKKERREQEEHRLRMRKMLLDIKKTKMEISALEKANSDVCYDE